MWACLLWIASKRVKKGGFLMAFDGKIVIVTGSSSGIGKEIALEFASKGSIVVVNGRNKTSVDSVVNEIVQNGGSALGIVADVTKKLEVVNLVSVVVGKLGTVDVLVNNAGGGSGSKTVEDLDEKDWDEVIDRNLKSVFLCSQAVLKILKRQKSGRIINIASQAGRALTILAGPHYASAKAGVVAFTKQLANELAIDGITVNTVAPGIVNSGPRLEGVWNSFSEEKRNKFIEDIPVKRLGVNGEIAAAVLFLASQEASYIVGACIDVNGGRWML